MTNELNPASPEYVLHCPESELPKLAAEAMGIGYEKVPGDFDEQYGDRWVIEVGGEMRDLEDWKPHESYDDAMLVAKSLQKIQGGFNFEFHQSIQSLLGAPADFGILMAARMFLLLTPAQITRAAIYAHRTVQGEKGDA